jgi:hypothetical protein
MNDNEDGEYWLNEAQTLLYARRHGGLRRGPSRAKLFY